MIVELLTSGLTAKLAAATAVLALGGTVVAARTGVLPASAQQVAHDLFAGVGVPVPPPQPAPSVVDDDDRDDGVPSAKPSVSKIDNDDKESALALCREYKARLEKTPDPVLAQRLAKLAGGTDQVEAFCDGVLAGEDGPKVKLSPEPRDDGEQ